MTQDASLPFATRLWFAWACFFQVLFDGAFAARAFRARLPEGPSSAVPTPPPAPAPVAAPVAPVTAVAPPASPPASTEPDTGPALQLLALFQREGRFVDFLEQEVTSFSDDEVGAAARVVHEGCRRALRAHTTLAPVRPEDEGAKITLEAGFSPSDVKLTGNVQGSAPYRGTLVHRGWRAQSFRLPTALPGHDAHVLAPAEVEL